MRYARLLMALLVLAGSPAGAQVRVQPAAEAGVAAGGQAGAAGASSIQSSAPRFQLNGPSLVPTLSSPLSPAVDAGSAGRGASVGGAGVKPVVLAAPAGSAVGLPASKIRSVKADGPEAGPGLVPAVEGSVDGPGSRQGPEEAGRDGGEAEAYSGSVFFDGNAKKTRGALGSLFDGMRSWFRKPDHMPDFPGKPGDNGRIAGRDFRLGGRIGEFDGANLYTAEMPGFGTVGVLLYPPEALERMRESVRGLRGMDGLDLAQNRLIAADFDKGLVIQWDRSFNPAPKVLEGRFLSTHYNGLTELTAKFLLAGKTADLSPENLIWDHWTSHWTRVSGAGFRDGSAWDVLSQVFAADLGGKAGLEPAEFYSAIRARLGPDSKAWKKVLQEAEGVPELKRQLDALARKDAARPPPPGLEFEAAAPDEILDDSIVTPRQMRKRLGYDPLAVKEKRNLHFDEGKLNTEIREIRPPGKPVRVTKASRRGIIQNELLLRKIVRRWFSRYFDTPGSLAVLGKEDAYMGSYMLMEKVSGSGAWTAPKLSMAQRVALAALAHTFGISDMNPGNLLAGDGKTILIDFEQALSRRTPVSNRLGSTGLIDELPWVRERRGPGEKAGYGIEVEDFFQGVRDWRAELAKPQTQAELRQMMLDSGFSEDEAGAYLARFNANAQDLLWTIATDVEYARSEYR